MVRNLDCPHLFFTFSAADIQWLDLHVQMPDFPGREAFTTDPLRHRKASQRLQKHQLNPWRNFFLYLESQGFLGEGQTSDELTALFVFMPYP